MSLVTAAAASLPTVSATLLQNIPEGPYRNLLLAIVVLLVIVLVGRFVLSVAWKLLLVAGAVVGGLYVVSLVLG